MADEKPEVPSTEIPSVKSVAHACRLVTVHLMRMGIEHAGLRDKCIDAVARAVRQHGIPEAAKLTPLICAEVTREHTRDYDALEEGT